MKTAVSLVQLHSQTGGSPPSDTYPLLDTEIYQIFREYLQHEDGLANNRLSWMLTIHGFLYASYAFTIQTKIQVAQRISSDLLTHPGADSAGDAGSYPVPFLIASIWQVDSVIFLICVVGFFISFVALQSIRAAGKANETILKVFEKQFGVQPAFGAPETVLVANKLILPTIAGGGDHQNIPRGFLSAAWIPVFLMSGWVFSLLFDAWLIWYGRMG
jgi:hypothetical protein